MDDIRSNAAVKARQEYKRQKEAFCNHEKELAQYIIDARKELAAMPCGGHPSNRRKELEGFLKEQEELSMFEHNQGRDPGRPPKEQFTPMHQ